MKFKVGQCSFSGCQYFGPLVNATRMLCRIHNEMRLAANRKPKPRSRPPGKLVKRKYKKYYTKKKEATGEGEMFDRLNNSRPHVCEVCGRRLKELIAHNFAHILSKGSYPSLRLDEEDVAILCWDFGQGCHEKWDTKAHSELKDLPEWKNIFEREEKLKQKYYLRT